MKTKPRTKKFDRYFYYKESVQSPEADISFFIQAYKSFYNKKPLSFREDFCGTFFLGTTWVKMSPQNQAFVVDHDKVPLSYGKAHHIPLLNQEEKKTAAYISSECAFLPTARSRYYFCQQFLLLCFQEKGDDAKVF